MEELETYDIVSVRNQLAVVIESDLLPPDDAIVVIPLFRDYPAITKLNPTIHFADDAFILATRMIASIRRTTAKKVGSARHQRDDITRAVDVLMSGI